MIELSGTVYLLIKALHVIAIIAWMAGLLYLPRLFVYHTKAQTGSELSETLKIMERRLLKIIMNPAMILSFILGVLLVLNLNASVWSSVWIYVKLFCVAGLMVAHMCMGKWRKDFENDRNEHSEKFFRTANEVPTVLMIVAVLAVIVQPF